jgi:hypothetical protein
LGRKRLFVGAGKRRFENVADGLPRAAVQSHSFTSTGVLGAAVVPVGGVFRTDSIRQDADLITARINYRFNWGGRVVRKY